MLVQRHHPRQFGFALLGRHCLPELHCDVETVTMPLTELETVEWRRVLDVLTWLC